MSYQGSGLTDKIYWRRKHGLHAFKRLAGSPREYGALCNQSITIKKLYGQSNRRPPSMARCAICDGLEMQRRGWDEGGPTSPGWYEGEETE